MPRRARTIIGGYVYHILNRANGRLRLFKKDPDFAAFEAIIAEANDRVPMRILGYVVMGNHWHFVVWPRRRRGRIGFGILSLAVRHARPALACPSARTSGMGHVYQGRFKSFPSPPTAFTQPVRYVERNPLRAGVVRRRIGGGAACIAACRQLGTSGSCFATPPVAIGPDWAAHVNSPQSEAELEAIRHCANRGQPFGSERPGRRK